MKKTKLNPQFTVEEAPNAMSHLDPHWEINIRNLKTCVGEVVICCLPGQRKEVEARIAKLGLDV